MKTKKYILLLLLMLFASSIEAQVAEYEYKAAFIERFTRFVEWPDAVKKDTFKIVVLGENPFNTTLDELFNGIKIKDQNVVIIYTNEIEDLAESNLVFISSSETRRVKEILAFTDQQPMLTIGDSKEFCANGGHINMYVDGNYVRYEINPLTIEQSGLTVSSLLLASAKIITTDE